MVQIINSRCLIWGFGCPMLGNFRMSTDLPRLLALFVWNSSFCIEECASEIFTVNFSFSLVWLRGITLFLFPRKNDISCCKLGRDSISPTLAFEVTSGLCNAHLLDTFPFFLKILDFPNRSKHTRVTNHNYAPLFRASF